MRKIKIEIIKTIKHFDIIEVKASCIEDAKELARQIAKKQDHDCYWDGNIKIENKEYPRINWSEKDKPTYKAEVIYG